VSVPATFGAVFVQACRATAKDTASDMTIADPAETGLSLVVCGANDGAFVFSNEGVHFKDADGRGVRYGWQDLDFVLPGDLSLARDTLATFSDVEGMADRIARAAGYVAAAAAVALLAFGLVDFVYGIFGPPILWLHANWGTFGDMLSLIGVVLVCSALAPFAIPILIGIAATGGAFGLIGNWLGRQVRPLVRWLLALKFGHFANGITVIHSRWVKPPWGTQTTLLHDFIMIGVKLRRRGLT
jgi:hypothetical protein